MDIILYIVNENALNRLFQKFPLWALILAVIITIFMLSKGADWMIDAAVNLALRTKLPKIVIGATILSLGTTAPEAFVSVMAAFMGNPGLALGNGVGSIIADTGLIFGLTLLVTHVPLNRWILNRAGWWKFGSAMFLIFLSVLAFFLNREDPKIDQWMGIILLILLVLYMWMTYKWARSGKNPESLTESDMEIESSDHKESLLLTLVMLIGGLTLVIIGSRLLIPAAAEIARRLAVPEDVIATTMVALGTSLPELSTAFAAIKKGHPEITVGNIIGADILNVLFVIGLASLAVPLSIPTNFFTFHFPVMFLMLLSLRIFIGINRSGMFKRWQGAWLLLIYLCYVILQYVILK